MNHKKAIAYIRVSTTHQDVERQRIKFKEYCKNNNLQANEEIIDFSISDENQFNADLDDIYSSCQDMKCKTEEEKLDQTRTVIESMGSKGYIAVDVENQINMANAENAEMFLSEVAENRDAGCTILQVMYDKSFVRFDFK